MASAFEKWANDVWFRGSSRQAARQAWDAALEEAAKKAAAKYAELHEMRSRSYVQSHEREHLETAGRYVNEVEQAIRELKEQK